MLKFRLAAYADSPDIFSWRNDAHTRLMALTTDVIDPATHEVWFAASLANPDRIMVMVESSIDDPDTNPVAIVRFDISGEEAFVSINMNPAARGGGLAVPSLLGAEQFLPDGRKVTLIAEIKPENTASLRTFERAGYQLVPSTSGDARLEKVEYRKHLVRRK